LRPSELFIYISSAQPLAAEHFEVQLNSKEDLTLIVGAGLTGLTAAYKLSQAGKKCLLLEKDDRVGGMCRTYLVDGIPFDLGPHLFFHNPDSAAESLMYELLRGEEVLEKKTCHAIYAGGKYWKQPINPFKVLFLPWRHKKDFFLARLSRGEQKQLHRDSLAYSISKTIGYSCYSELYGPTLLKKTHVPAEQLHRHWLHRAGRSIDNHLENSNDIHHFKAILHLLRMLFFPRYYYPVRGFEIFAEKLWQHYEDNGGETLLNCGPIALDMQGKRIVGARVNGRTFSVKDVIWTGPINELNELLGAKDNHVDSVDTLIACLTYKQTKRQQRPFVYVYYPQEDVIFNRLYFPAAIYGDRSPSGREGVCLEINVKSVFENRNDDEVVGRACGDLERLGLFDKSDLRDYRLFREKDCMPIHELDYEAELERTFDKVHQYENLYAVGRKGGYFFCQTPGAVSQGLKVASHILAVREKEAVKKL